MAKIENQETKPLLMHSRATEHMCYDRDQFISIMKLTDKRYVRMRHGTSVKVQGNWDSKDNIEYENNNELNDAKDIQQDKDDKPSEISDEEEDANSYKRIGKGILEDQYG
ncbi:hypothetical protein WA026_021106 [Henosepilachna vigintioctopunctata]|uniref:Retrovirus-related Pol polyprotein from transposon TNT 1-94-like beta-barrel domain-containing protein n=1 Tax=Henosepilachna vigintioctopunctata TaxID=420089 RepID=A0AAW1V514_9CUCU